MKKRVALFKSVIALLLCISMLAGSTFAWFTDSVRTGINTIAAGNLDVELFRSNAAVQEQRVDSATKLFMDLQGKPILWEPGVVSYENLRVVNAGELALAYQLAINTANENFIVDPSGAQYGLSQILKVGVVPGGITATDRAGVVASVAETDWTTLSSFLRSGSLLPEGAGTSEETWGVVIYWQPGENDNFWNLNNGKTLSSGEVLQIDLGVRLLATQESYESDSFGSDFDTQAKAAVFPNFVGGSASATVVPNEQNQTAAAVTMSAGAVAATVPAGVQLAQGVTELKLDVSMMGASGANIALGENEDMRSLDVHIEGVAADNTTPITVTLSEVAPVGLNMGNYKVYHVEADGTKEMTLVDAAADFTAHNQFKYDPATGDIVLYMATFSEVAITMEPENAWKGEFDYSWYTNVKARTGANDYTIANADQLAGFGAIVGGMNGKDADSFKGQTVKLISDINLGDKESENNPDIIFYPIGYYNDEGTYEKSDKSITSGLRNFEGTFDGQGHTVSNFYQNTWEMKGDHDWYSPEEQYYRDGMGLFGKVYKGTVKNLAVSHFSSDGEIATTGCIAAYADGATFENIAIFDCNPRVYNIGNGGIVGCVGWYAKEAGLKTTFTNITVDNSNKISALWGSYDVACGGIVGQYYPTSGQTSAGTPKNAGVHFENCHVSAIMDVYNDVCGNYQYYAYRYAGMIIGSIRENTTNEDGKTIPDMTGISATGCTVNYGDWNDYYYCEFEKNGHPSYSGPDDYKFSRVPDSELNFTDSNGNGKVDADERTSVIGCKHNHTDAENNQAIYLPFHQLFTGYGWGVNSIGLEEYSGIVTNLDITEGDQEASVEKFQTKFTNDYLYRVGNQNEFTIGNLFAAIEGKKINDAGVYVRIDKQYDDSNVTCKFTANTSNWTEGTLKFEGTGVVDIVIQDYDFCKSTTLKLEVVDAVNATTATSATENNVVLLNDCSFSSLEVSGGYTLYGNGFTMTCGSDSASLSFDQFVKLESGTLDNVQIVCPNCDYAALYSSQLKDTGANRYQTTNGTTRYYNAKSAVLATGNSQILNSRISGGRAALYASNGNIVVDNSRLEGGAVATVLISAANSFVFRDATLIQKPTASTYDSNKTLMGMSVLYLCDTDGNATPTTLEGSFVQNAWADSSCTAYMPTGTSTIASTVLGKTDYTHTVNGNTCVNLGFAYMPNEGTTVSQPNNITDNRSNKEAIPYAYEGVSASVPVSGINVTINTYVYSYRNASGTNNDFTADSDYVPDKYSDIITVTYSDTAEGLTTDKSFGTDGWVYELNVDLDKLSGYSLDFSKLSMSVNGVTVTDFKVNGNAKPTSPVAVTAGGTTYTLTATVNGEEYTATYKVTGTETSKESPSKISGPTATGFGVAKSYGGDWSGAADVLTGVKIKYWSVAENKYIEYDFSNFTVPGNAGKLNGTNNYWEYTHTNNDFTLKVTNTVAIHSGKSVYGMPILGTDGKLYFTISSTNGYVGSGTTSRAITMQYEFTDNNGGEKLTFTHTFNISYDKANQYSYGDLSGSGTLTKLKDGCVTSDTLITLADGSKKRIDQLTYQDELLVWDFYNGCYTTTVPSVLFNHGNGVHKVTNLRFSDGTTVGVIDEHEFFDVDANSFVNITEENVSQYLGHRFAKATDDGYTVVTLKGYLYTEEETGKWTILTAKHFNAIANGMLSLTPDPTNKCDAFFRRYEIGENMKFDEKKMQADIEKYGLFTYADLSAYVTYEEFVAFDGGFYKTLVGKGLITVEDIVKALATYAPNH